MYTLKSKFHSRDCIEPTYFEIAVVKKGIATCNFETTKKILEKRGYKEVEEIKPKVEKIAKKPKKTFKRKK